MSNYEPLVSVIINNYNYGHFLPDAIESALQQTYQHYEVIVVDDGSTDNSHDAIARYGDQVIPVLKANGGQASAFNAGFAASHGEIICFLDADDLFVPEKLEKIVEVFSKNAAWGWCFHPLDFRPGDQLHKTQPAPQTVENPIQEYDLRAKMQQGKLEKDFPYPSTSGLCFRRSLLEQILPMPVARGTLLNDGYLIFTGLGLSPGITLNNKLGIYRLHGNNAHGFYQIPGTDEYAIREEKQPYRAKLYLLKGYWIHKQFPQFARLGHYFFSGGMGIALRYGGLDEEAKQLISNYVNSLTWPEKIEIYGRTLYAYLQNLKN